MHQFEFDSFKAGHLRTLRHAGEELNKGRGVPDIVREHPVLHPYPGHSSSQDITRNLSFGNAHKHVMWSKPKDNHPPLRNAWVKYKANHVAKKL